MTTVSNKTKDQLSIMFTNQSEYTIKKEWIEDFNIIYFYCINNSTGEKEINIAFAAPYDNPLFEIITTFYLISELKGLVRIINCNFHLTVEAFTTGCLKSYIARKHKYQEIDEELFNQCKILIKGNLLEKHNIQLVKVPSSSKVFK